MEGSIKELISYRLERSKEMLEAAEMNLGTGHLRTSLNRSYYAVFHAMRAANITEGFDSSKHSGVIAFFNRTFLKEGIIDKKLSVIIKNTSYLREKSDYDDFYIASKEDTELQYEQAKIFVAEVERYLNHHSKA